MRRIVSYKFRAYPNESQKVLLAKHFGCCRYVYNHFLTVRRDEYLKDKTHVNYCKTAEMLTVMKSQEKYEWLCEVNSQSLQSALRNLEASYNRFFGKLGQFPVYHSKNGRQSFTIPQGIRILGNRVSIQKFREGVRFKQHREICGEILHATFSREPSGKYYISFACEQEDYRPIAKADGQVGIDVGIKELAVCSNGKRYENEKVLEKEQKKLTYVQRRFCKTKKGSKRRRRAKAKIARLHETIRNRRIDHIHKVTNEIIRENQTICLEDLNVKGMMKNHHLARSIASASFNELVRQLEYKGEWNERTVVKIDRFFPSSKTCYNCGFIKQDLTLADREWVCPQCGEKVYRDFNAAKNILRQGLNKICSGCGTQSDVKRKRVEASGVLESVKREAAKSLVSR